MVAPSSHRDRFISKLKFSVGSTLEKWFLNPFATDLICESQVITGSDQLLTRFLATRVRILYEMEPSGGMSDGF